MTNQQETLHIFQDDDRLDTAPLTQYSEPIPNIDKTTQELAVAMGITLARKGGFGLAAPQVGVNKRLIVVKVNQLYTAMINPVIIKYSEREDISKEGCLSIRLGAKRYDVPRRRSVIVTYLDLTGKQQELKAAKRLAYCIQHEVDHLDGILISEKGVLV